MVAAWAGDEGALCEAEAMRKATGTTALWVEATAQEAVDLVASTGPVAVVVWALGKVAATQAVVMLVMTAAAAVDWAAMARVRAQEAVARLRATVVMTREAVVAAVVAAVAARHLHHALLDGDVREERREAGAREAVADRDQRQRPAPVAGGVSRVVRRGRSGGWARAPPCSRQGPAQHPHVGRHRQREEPRRRRRHRHHQRPLLAQRANDDPHERSLQRRWWR